MTVTGSSSHAETTNFNKSTSLDKSPIFSKSVNYDKSVALNFSSITDLPSISDLPSIFDSETSVASASTFAKGIDDLPLMAGLEPTNDKDVVFVSSSGRIVQAEAKGPVEADQIYSYYQKTLPPLGWKAIDGRTYERNQERLRISANSNATESVTQVRFSVQPMAQN